jgi:hypothetical protein
MLGKKKKKKTNIHEILWLDPSLKEELDPVEYVDPHSLFMIVYIYITCGSY